MILTWLYDAFNELPYLRFRAYMAFGAATYAALVEASQQAYER